MIGVGLLLCGRAGPSDSLTENLVRWMKVVANVCRIRYERLVVTNMVLAKY